MVIGASLSSPKKTEAVDSEGSVDVYPIDIAITELSIPKIRAAGESMNSFLRGKKDRVLSSLFSAFDASQIKSILPVTSKKEFR